MQDKNQTMPTPAAPKESNTKLLVIILAVLAFLITTTIILSGIATSIINNTIGANSNNPNALDENSKKQISEKVINYLNKKYGDQDFSIKHIDYKTLYVDYKTTDYVGFVAEVRTQILVEKFGGDPHFSVYLNGTDPNSTTIDSDGFMHALYQEPLDPTPDFIGSGYGVKMSANVYDAKIPNDFGHIPSVNEMLELGAIQDNKIELSLSDENNPVFGDDEAARLAHVKKFIDLFADFFEISNKLNLELDYCENNLLAASYRIIITDTTIHFDKTTKTEAQDFPREKQTD